MKRWLVGEFDKLARGIRSRCLQVWASYLSLHRASYLRRRQNIRGVAMGGG